MDVHKNNFFASVHACAEWVEPAWPAKPIFLTLALLMGCCRVMPTEPASLLIN